jgi:hypothetical protein
LRLWQGKKEKKAVIRWSQSGSRSNPTTSKVRSVCLIFEKREREWCESRPRSLRAPYLFDLLDFYSSFRHRCIVTLNPLLREGAWPHISKIGTIDQKTRFRVNTRARPRGRRSFTDFSKWNLNMTTNKWKRRRKRKNKAGHIRLATTLATRPPITTIIIIFLKALTRAHSILTPSR